jgi:hypothetical protein
VFTSVLGPTQPPIQWVPGALSLGVKWPGREADHSLPYNAEVKECVELYLCSPIRLKGVGYLVKHSDKFSFHFYLKGMHLYEHIQIKPAYSIKNVKKWRQQSCNKLCVCECVCKHDISNSTEQSSSWEANSHSAVQRIRLLWCPKFHYCVHKRPSQISFPEPAKFHAHPHNLVFKMQLHTVASYTLRFSKWTVTVQASELTF